MFIKGLLLTSLIVTSLMTSLFVDSILAIHNMKIMEEIITTSVYKRYSQTYGPMYINAIVQILDIKEVNDLDNTLSSVHRLTFWWYDEYYEWDAADYNNASFIYIPSNYLWTPDFAVLNEVTTLMRFDKEPSIIYLEGTYWGYHLWTPVIVSETRCSPDLVYYPYDTLECPIKIGTVLSTMGDVTFYTTRCGRLKQVTGTSTWRLERVEKKLIVEIFDDALQLEHDVLYCVYHFKRKSEYVILNTMLPLVFLAVLNSCSFVIPCSSGEKISYSMTLFLTFAVYVTIIMQSMPATSDTVSYIQLYLISQLSISVVIILVNALQLRFKDMLELEIEKDDIQNKSKDQPSTILVKSKDTEGGFVEVTRRNRLCKKIRMVFSLRTILPKIDLIGFVTVLILQLIFCTWYFVSVSSN